MRRSLQIIKIIVNAPLYVLLCTATTYKDASSVDKKITEDVLHKIYTEKGAIPGICLGFSTVEVRKEFTYFQMATS